MLRLSRSLLIPIVALALTAGCADDSPVTTPDNGARDLGVNEGGWPDIWQSDQFVPPDGFILGKEVVYAQTATDLFKVDPQTLAVTYIAAFTEPGAVDPPRITDIALDKKGRMIGVTKESVYEIDVKTAVCTKLSTAKAHYVGLSYVVDNNSIDKKEYLMGLDKEGAVYEIDPATGQSTALGGLGSDPVDTGTDLRAAGDIVSIRGFKTLATVERPSTVSEDSDWLAQIDEHTGKATLIGKVGYKGVWGLGFWKHEGKNKVFGFTTAGEFILIDVQTGAGTLQSMDASNVWWGAGVTTDAPTID